MAEMLGFGGGARGEREGRGGGWRGEWEGWRGEARLGFGGRAPRVIYVEASGSRALVGLRAWGGPRALLGRRLIVPCQAGPRAEASA
jgi:hypothetical protein